MIDGAQLIRSKPNDHGPKERVQKEGGKNHHHHPHVQHSNLFFNF